MKPLDPRLLREARAARWFIAGVVALATLGVGSTIVIAWNLTAFITGVFVEGLEPGALVANLIAAVTAGLVKAGLLWIQEYLAVRAAAAARSELRRKYLLAISAKSAAGATREDSTAMRHILVTRGLDALDPYFARYLPQLVLTLIATPALGAAIWLADWTSGIVLLCTIPLIPLFMILIGWATRAVQQKQLDALAGLSQHFIEVLRGLATLKIFGREWLQVKTMTDVGEQYRKRTMKVLTVSFLSGFALELAASLSVALMAVLIGFRLIDGTLGLATGLFVLMLAPEAYLPMRAVGANFHAAAEGVLASESVLDQIDATASAEANQLTGGAIPATASLTVLVGPSGAGKTTQLEAWRAELPAQTVAWLPQSNFIFAGTVLQNIAGPGTSLGVEPNPDLVKQAMQLASLDDLELATELGESGAAVSGGQRQRVGLARAFYRVLSGDAQTMLLDEPISAIDEARSRIIVANLKSIAERGARVIAVSHQDSLRLAADHVIEVAGQ